MMKHLLFSVALSAIALSGNAQTMLPAQTVKADMQKRVLTKTPQSLNTFSAVTPLKSPSTQVGYARPTGTLYSEYAFGSTDDDQMAALFIPALKEVKFEHYCAKTPTWSMNGTELTSTDEDGNLLLSFGAGAQEGQNYAAFYAPTCTVGKEDFSLTGVLMTGIDFLPVTPANPVNVKLYTGFQDGPAWGTGSVLEEALTSQIEGAEPFGYLQAYEKPISPMYVKSFHCMAWSEQADMLAGKTLTAQIFEVDSVGKPVDLSQPKMTLLCKAVSDQKEFPGGGGYYGYLYFYNIVKDPMMGETEEPFVIDYKFGFLLSGYDQEGVDVRFMLQDQADDENELYFAQPTRVATSVDGEINYYYWASIDGDQQYMYTLSHGWDMYYDNVQVADEFESAGLSNMNCLHISNDGKECHTEGQEAGSEYDFQGIYVYTVLPWTGTSGANYEFVGCPDWLHIEVDESYYESEEAYGLNVVYATADPIAEGEGRSASVVVKSAKGAVGSATLRFAQGNDTGVKSAVAETKNNGTTFNVAGQKVSNAVKGVFIQNGKKFVK